VAARLATERPVNEKLEGERTAVATLVRAAQVERPWPDGAARHSCGELLAAHSCVARRERH
jgi:hypothetical protein